MILNASLPAQDVLIPDAERHEVSPSAADLLKNGIHHAPRSKDSFENNDGSRATGSVLKWRWNAITHGLPPAPENGYRFPVDQTDIARLKSNRSDTTLTWIGHATALLQIDGVNIITDPVFSERASPFSFAGPKRKVLPAPGLSGLPHIDVVLISHSHYDHLDTASVQSLYHQPGGPPLFLVPLGIKSWLAKKGIDNATEFDWSDHVRACGLDFWFVPANHWSARSPFDRNQTLWGGWVIKTLPASSSPSSPFSVYFAGDSGYSADFGRLGAAFGGFDLALIPIGAYAPRWFLSTQHMDPQEAVQVFLDIKAKRAIGIHWGTFELTDEPLDEPPKKLEEAARAADLPTDAFTVLRHGQTMQFDRQA